MTTALFVNFHNFLLIKFLGMSVGLQYTTADVWALFGAVMCHEVVIGFSLGLQFIKNMFSTKRILIIAALCSIIMPIGKEKFQE